jgi:hypothetical protein
VLTICGVIANCDDWPDIALFAQSREAWFRRFLALPHGVPAHDTFDRVFAALDPRALERCCIARLRQVAGVVGAGLIAIDGKTLRGSAGRPFGPLHLVSAWATQARLTLGQVQATGDWLYRVCCVDPREMAFIRHELVPTLDIAAAVWPVPVRCPATAATSGYLDRRIETYYGEHGPKAPPPRSILRCRPPNLVARPGTERF